MRIYQTFDGTSQTQIDLHKQTKKIFAEGLAHYFNCNFKEAENSFKKVLSINPSDKAADYYLSQSITRFKTGTDDNWNGVEIMTTK